MLEGRNLACVRGGRLVFRDVNFTLRPGEALVVSGPNGSGKSTLLRLVSGLLPASAGQVIWDGTPVEADPEAFHRELHYFGHLDAIKPTLTVAENLSFWVQLRGGDPSRQLAALDTFSLGELGGLPARVLSAGQRRRLGLARLSALPVPLWLLDEPTIALDWESVAALHREITSHLASGGMAVIATNVPMDVQNATALDLAPAVPDEVEEGLWA